MIRAEHEDRQAPVRRRADEVTVAMPTVNGGEVALILPTVPKPAPA